MNKLLTISLVSGSERSGGNTSKIVSYIEGRLKDRKVKINLINLANRKISPCGSCGDCNYKSSQCEIKDDMPYIIEKLIQSDVLIYLVSVHAFGMAHPMQIFLERGGGWLSSF